MNPDLLLHLRPALPNLVDRFTLIRARRIGFGMPDPQGTLDQADLATLQALYPRLAPRVDITPVVGQSPIATTAHMAHMEFRTTFWSGVTPGPPFRVIRFVRAAQYNRNFQKAKVQSTVPGYVHYQTRSETTTSATGPDRATVRTALNGAFQVAAWSFDGPREEFSSGELVNVDTPGTRYTELPYAITADFLIVLYHEGMKRVLEVGHVGASLGVWGQNDRTFVRSLTL